jgi:branched-chain amino acid aminotransferase
VSNPAPLSQRSDMVVFLNGEFIPADQARVGIMSHAFSYGTGCFEGIRGYWNAQAGENYLFRLREHFERLHRSARILSVTLPYSVDRLMEIAVELVRRNDFRENCYLRPCAFKADETIGVKLHGLEDQLSMLAVPMGDYVSTDGLRCGVSSWRRIDDNMIPARAKVTGAYVNSAFAKSEAQQNGFDEAIMLTAEGHVSEGSAENIFLLFGNELVTPPPTENILLGITRETVMQLARRELELIVRERVIDRTELYVADEIILTGTGAQLAPVVAVDHRPVGTGVIGPVSRELQRLYGEVVRGMRPEYMDWLTPVFGTATAAEEREHELVADERGKAAGNGHKPTKAASNGRAAGSHRARASRQPAPTR